MGVDCNILLPHEANVESVANIMGVVSGLVPTKIHFSGNLGNDFYVQVPGAVIETNTKSIAPNMLTIMLTAPDGKTLVDGETAHMAYYFFQSGINYDDDIHRYRYTGALLSVRSTAYWISVGKRLVDYFGGIIDYCDCDDTFINYRKPIKKVRCNPQDGEEYQQLHTNLLNMKPITELELMNNDEFAAYSRYK